MNKTDLIDVVAASAKVSKTDAETVINSVLKAIKTAVKKGDDVTLLGFGTFTRTTRKARRGHDPYSGTEIQIPEMTLPKFRPGREFKELLH